MTITNKVFTVDGPGALQIALNAYLAGLTDPTILAWSVSMVDIQRRLGIQYAFMLTTEDGGATLGTPFLVDCLQAENAADLEALMAAYLVTYAGQFISSPKMVYDPTENSITSKIAALFMRNTTLGAGAANYLIAP